MLKNQNEATVVIRKNGQVDLYWNKKIIDSSVNYNEDYVYQEVSANFQGLILTRKSKKDSRVEKVKLSLS